MTSSQIFVEAGFDLDVIGKDVPEGRMRSWRKTYRTLGVNGLLENLRGKTSGKGYGRPKTRGVTDKDKIERLEATVAYLKAENGFLAKLRAKRRE